MKISHGNGIRVPDGPRINRRELYPRVKPLMQVSNLRSACEIIYQWSIIVAVAAGVWYFNHPVAYAIGMVLMASRQHAFLIVMHDAVHRCLFTNRFANEYVAELFLGMPINFMLRPFRAHHLAHHRLVGSDEDPDVEANELLQGLVGKQGLARVGAYALYVVRRAWMYLTVGTIFSLLLPARNPESRYTLLERILLLAWVGLWLGVFTWFGLWFDVIVLWVLPYFLIVPVFMFIRGRPEHDVAYTEEVRVSRYVKAGILERIFICPNFINYHSQHHLYPRVPSFNLPRLHEVLMEDPTFRRQAVITPGYWAWFRDAYLKPTRNVEPIARHVRGVGQVRVSPLPQENVPETPVPAEHAATAQAG